MVPASVEVELRKILDEYRDRCLWFLREDYYPSDAAQWDRTLRAIARHGDMQAFRRVEELRAWLSHLSSEKSAAS